MLELLYCIFIFPVEQVLDWALFTLFKAVKNYGVAILLLSLVVNLFMLKLTIYFDKKAVAFGTLKAEVDSKITEFKRAFKGAELQSYIRILYKQKHFHPIFALSSLGGLALQIPFFIAMIHLVENADFLQAVSFLWIADLSKPDSISLLGIQVHLLPFLMTFLTLINVFYSSKDFLARIQGSLIALLFLVLLYAMPSALVLYWTCNMAFSLIKAIIKKQNKTYPKTTKLEIIPNLATPTQNKKDSKRNIIFSLFMPHFALDSKTYKTYRNISILAIINICFLICVFTPFAVYSSDVSQFESSQTYKILSILFGTFLCASCIVIYITSFFYKSRLFVFGVFVASALVIFGIINTFIFTGNYGAMDHFILQKPDFHSNSMQNLFFALLALFGSVALVSYARKYLFTLFGITFATFVIGSILSFYGIYNANKAYILPQSDTSQTNNTLQPYEKELFSYSKTEKNIVIIVLDMFSGSHIRAILEQFPEYREKLSGFTLFDNAISTTNSTIHSIATLIGGEYYSVYNMNGRKDNLAESITESFGRIGDAFVKNGYGVGYFMSEASQSPEYIQRYNKDIFVTQNSRLYLDYYLAEEPENARAFQLANEGSVAILKHFLSFGVFRFSPHIVRDRIYNNGLWLRHKVVDYNVRSSLPYTSSLYAFTHLHNLDSRKPTFKYLHSMITHVPYGMYYDGGACRFQSTENKLTNKTAWVDYPHKHTMLYRNEAEKNLYFKHYDAEVCALHYISSYLAWLKENNIYDNTQIFIVSDHAGFDNINIPSFVASKEGRPDVIFLLKDFHAKGTLQIDSRLMANYDMASIFCANLPNGCPNVPQNILQRYPQNRELILTIPASAGLEQHKKNEWLIDYYFRVKDNIYDEKNWQDITEEVKNGTFKLDGIEH